MGIGEGNASTLFLECISHGLAESPKAATVAKPA